MAAREDILVFPTYNDSSDTESWTWSPLRALVTLASAPPGSLDELRIILQPDHDAPLLLILDVLILFFVLDVLQLHHLVLPVHHRPLPCPD